MLISSGMRHVQFEIDPIAAALVAKDDGFQFDIHQNSLIKPLLPPAKNRAVGFHVSTFGGYEESEFTPGWYWDPKHNIWGWYEGEEIRPYMPGYRLPQDLRMTGDEWVDWFIDGNGDVKDLYLFQLIDSMPEDGREPDRKAIAYILQETRKTVHDTDDCPHITGSLGMSHQVGVPLRPLKASPPAEQGFRLNSGFVWWADENIWVWSDGLNANIRYYTPIAGWRLPNDERLTVEEWQKRLSSQGTLPPAFQKSL